MANPNPINKFKKGQSGNLKGRPPKGYSISEMMKHMLNSDPETKERIGEKIIQLANKGDIQAIKLLWNYMDGLPKQDVGLQGDINIIIDRALEKNE